MLRHERIVLPARVDGRAPASSRARRDGGNGRAAARAHPPGPRRGPPARGEGDRPAQPARMVELPLLPLVRAGVGVPELRCHARASPRARRGGLPPLRPPRDRAAGLPGLRARCRWRATGPGPSSSSASWRSWWRRCRCSGSTRTSAAAAGVATVLRRFDEAPAGVLVGTQMVAKGHDFPDVTLGVVLDADATLRFPDFRAEERTFALVAQLAGRSGRGRARGARDRAGARPLGRVAALRRAPRRRGLPRRPSCGDASCSATRRTAT